MPTSARPLLCIPVANGSCRDPEKTDCWLAVVVGVLAYVLVAASRSFALFFPLGVPLDPLAFLLGFGLLLLQLVNSIFQLACVIAGRSVAVVVLFIEGRLVAVQNDSASGTAG